MTMHRRHFLRITALGAASTLTGSACAATAGDSADLRVLARPELLEMVGAEQVRAIGARYRETVPTERDEAALRAAIHGRHALLVLMAGAPRVNPSERVRQDFAEGRTVEVDGWVLSVTEARQCALFALADA